jgi:CMP-N,N'-diacetyllegionaminic acid synthase
MPKIIAVIPAKGESVGVPGKNIKPFFGKPLVQHTYECAILAGCFRRIAVSTDSDEVAKVARPGGYLNLIRRPEHLQGDGPTLPVFQHAVEETERKYGEEYDWAMLLQPTSPLRAAEDIALALEIAKIAAATSVTAVSEIKRGRKVYQSNGSIYLVRRDVLLGGSLFGDRPQLVLIPAERGIDIDTPADWTMAAALYGEAQGG